LNAFVYIYRGEGEFGSGSTGGTLHQALILDQAGEVFRATTKTGMRFLLLAGKPLNEPVAR
jgi:redox-sensitive bicupin YhaK (pirin superfamily)